MKYTQRKFASITDIPRATLQIMAKRAALVPFTDENGKIYYTDEQIQTAHALHKTRQKPAPMGELEFGTQDTPPNDDPEQYGVDQFASSDGKLSDNPDLDAEKNNAPATADAGNTHGNCSTPADDVQDTEQTQHTPADDALKQLENLPQEILRQDRFFSVGKEKSSLPKAWSNPDNQLPITAAFKQSKARRVGFDICGHERGADYVLFDLDHIFDDNDAFINDAAEKWTRYILDAFEGCYCEKSCSGRGLHIIGEPSPDKFPTIVNKDGVGVLYFDKERGAKLEIFYKPKSRYVLLTGNLYKCAPQAEIPHGEVVDDVLSTILAEIKKTAPAKKQRENAAPYSNTERAELDPAEIDKILDLMPAKELSRTEWANIGIALKNQGFDFETFDKWSSCDDTTDADGKPRYRPDDCRYQWDSFPTGETDPDRQIGIGTLIKMAKEFGYEPPPRYKTTRDKVADCPVDLQIPYGFTFDWQGIKQVIPPRKKDAKPTYEPVANMPIVPTRILTEPGTYATKYELAFKARRTWRIVSVDGRTLQDPRRVLDLANSGVLIEDAKALAKFFARIIARNEERLREIDTYQQPGWHAGKFIYPTGGEDYLCRRAGFDYDSEFAAHGDPEEWKRAFADAIKKGGAIATVFVGTALAAPLIKPIGDVGNLQVLIHGRSGGGKSALNKVAASIYGNPERLMRTFGATLKNRQAVAAAYNDLPTFFDELETNGQRNEDALADCLYDFSEGKGNQAQKRNGDAREHTVFTGARLMTGERPSLKHNDKKGAYKRLLQLYTGEELFDDETATNLHGLTKKHYGHFGRKWTEYIIAHVEDIRTRYKLLAQLLIDSHGNALPALIKHIALAATALCSFLECIGLEEYCNEGQAAYYAGVIADTLPTSKELDISARALDDLKSFIAAHEKFFIRPDGKDDTREPINALNLECFGRIYADGSVAFLPTELRKILEKELGYASCAALVAEWKEQGILKPNANRRFNHKQNNVHFFKKDVLVPMLTADEEAELKSYYGTTYN